MSGTIEERVMALAGMLQALKQVRRIAETGHSEAAVVEVALDSVFRMDADSAGEVYGGVARLQPGLKLLRDYFANQVDDASLPKLGMSVLQLERRFIASADTVAKVQAGIDAAAPLATASGSPAHPDVLSRIGTLYADTLSQLRPRVMVQGNPHYLGQANVVAEIRALLLAALRSAVLWRQLGGSLWDFLLRKRPMAQATERLLARAQA